LEKEKKARFAYGHNSSNVGWSLDEGQGRKLTPKNSNINRRIWGGAVYITAKKKGKKSQGAQSFVSEERSGETVLEGGKVQVRH